MEEACHNIRGMCFSIVLDQCSLPDWHAFVSLVSSALSGSYDGADDTFFVLMQSDVKGVSNNLSSKRSSVPLNPDTARRHSSKT